MMYPITNVQLKLSRNRGCDWFYRVATAQGKQGIWLLTFPDRENTGNLVNLIFYTGKIVATQGKFSKFRIFENFVIKVATR